MDDSFSKMLEKFGQQCGERSSSSIGNRQEALAIENKQDESGDDENEEEEEEEQEESEEEEEVQITPAPAQMTVAKIKKQLLGGSISKTQYDIKHQADQEEGRDGKGQASGSEKPHRRSPGEGTISSEQDAQAHHEGEPG